MNLAIVLLFGLGLLTLSVTNVMAVEKGPSGSQTSSSSSPSSSSSSSSPSSSSSSSPSSSSSSSSPSSSHSHTSSHHKSDYSQGSAAGANDGKVGVYDLGAACPSGSSSCAAGYKHSYVETCTKSSFGCGDGPSTLGSTSSKSSSHHHSTTTTNTRSTSSATSSPSSPPQKNITNLLIRVVTDNQTNWDGSYCCTPGTLNTQFMGNLSSPYTGAREFSVTCSGNFSAVAKIDSSASNPPHLTVSVLNNDMVIGSQTTNTTNTNATVNGKC